RACVSAHLFGRLCVVSKLEPHLHADAGRSSAHHFWPQRRTRGRGGRILAVRRERRDGICQRTNRRRGGAAGASWRRQDGIDARSEVRGSKCDLSGAQLSERAYPAFAFVRGETVLRKG